MPTTMPRKRCGHGAANASIAATSTSVASTPLHPASIDTANGVAEELITLPLVAIVASNTRISAADADATASVHGVTSHACAGGVNSMANETTSSTTKTIRNLRIARIVFSFTSLRDAGSRDFVPAKPAHCPYLALHHGATRGSRNFVVPAKPARIARI